MVDQIKRTMVHSAQEADTGRLVATVRTYSPGLVPGDLAYLDPSRPHDVQLHPMLEGEGQKGAPNRNLPGAIRLVWTSPSGHQLRSLVTLPAPHRKNIASNQLDICGAYDRNPPGASPNLRAAAPDGAA